MMEMKLQLSPSWMKKKKMWKFQIQLKHLKLLILQSRKINNPIGSDFNRRKLLCQVIFKSSGFFILSTAILSELLQLEILSNKKPPDKRKERCCYPNRKNDK